MPRGPHNMLDQRKLGLSGGTGSSQLLDRWANLRQEGAGFGAWYLTRGKVQGCMAMRKDGNFELGTVAGKQNGV
eukprot:5760769-Prorocentrum_lima.AAC.1